MGAALAVVAVVLVAARGRPPPDESGLASYYDEDFEGRPTASGEPFDPEALTAAHPEYPVGTILTVTNLDNGRTVRVRVTDRGPAPSVRREGVVIDLSEEAARRLDFTEKGKAEVAIEVERANES